MKKLLVAVLLVAGAANAGRSSVGLYSLPSGNPAVPGTLITSSQWNTNFNDLGNELTDSLSRSGKGNMSAAFLSIDGTSVLPGMAFVSETGTGDYRSAAGIECRSVLGSAQQCWTNQTTAITKGLWTVTTAYVINDTVQAGAFVFRCSVAGTSAATGSGPTPGVLTDNTVTWALVGGVTGSSFPNFVSAPSGITTPKLVLQAQATPAGPVNGQLWADSTTNHFAGRLNGSTVNFVASPISRTDQSAVGQQISSSCGNFSSGSAVELDVTNLSVTITTTGRPVMLVMQPDGSANPAAVGIGGTGSAIFIDRAGSNIAAWNTDDPTGILSVPATVSFLDPVAAGTYTYKIRIHPHGALMLVKWYVLAAYEL